MMTNLQGVQVTQQIATGVPTITYRRDRAILTNRELIMTLTGTATGGTIPLGGFIIPADIGRAPSATTWPAGWANTQSTLYDKYRFVSLKLAFQPVLPVTAGGAVGMWFDPSTTTFSVTSGFPLVSGNLNGKTTSVHEPMQIAVKPDQLNRLPQYVCGSDDVSSTVGQIVAVWSAIILGSTAVTGPQTIGYIWADYELEMINPSNPSAHS
jgi:hypothetical protein